MINQREVFLPSEPLYLTVRKRRRTAGPSERINTPWVCALVAAPSWGYGGG